MEQRVFSIIRRWLWLVALATILAALATYVLARRQTVQYQSSVRLIIGPGIDSVSPTLNDLRTGGQLMQTYAELATSRPTLQSVIDELALVTTPFQLERNVSIRTNEETQLLTISVTDSDPFQSMTTANAIAENLVLLSPSNDEGPGGESRRQMEAQLARLEASIPDIEAAIVKLEEQFDAAEDPEARRLLLTQLGQERTRLADNNQTVASLYDSLRSPTTNQVRIVEPAVEGLPVATQLQLRVLLGGLAGMILSAIVILVFEFLDDAVVKTPDSVTNITGLPALAGILEIKAGNSKLITITKPRSPISEAFRVLRTSIQFSSVDNPNRTLVVTSSIPGEGKSTTAANLAVVMAQAGHNVVLVDTDLRRPTQHEIFDLPNKRGVTSLLLEFQLADDDETIRELAYEVVRATRVEGLQFLTSGPLPPNPSELLGSAKMKRLLEVLEEVYDFVILDSPPILSVTDAAVLSVQADGVLVVARAGTTRKVQLTQAVEQLKEVNATLIGTVLNNRSPKDAAFGYLYYRDPDYLRDPSARVPARTGAASGNGWLARVRQRISGNGAGAVSSRRVGE